MGRTADRYRENWRELMVTGGRFGHLKVAFLTLAGITVLLWLAYFVMKALGVE